LTQGIWRDPKKFCNKGSSSQWQDVMTNEDMGLCEIVADRALDPHARRWMEQGSLAFADPKTL
jgi:hypothetical protein